MPQAFHSTRVITPHGMIEATVIVEDGRITDVLPGKIQRPRMQFESFGNKVIMPGAIDAHVHINEPGRAHWEGFGTATRAAAAGGITTVIEMPLNADPVTTTADALRIKLDAAKGKLWMNVGFYGGVVPGNINDLEGLLNAGVFGIKAFLTHSGIDEFPNVTEADLRQALPILKKHDAKLLVHCELESPASGVGATFTSSRTYAAYLASRPAKWETDAIALMIRLSEEFDVHVHIVHVSSAEALPLIRDAKKRGLHITAETCPHYLVFCAEEIPDGATEFKCAPPIRESANNELLWEALKDGTLDFVATDHSPAPPDIKEQQSGDFKKAWGGIAGLQFLLTAFWTGAKERGFSLEDVVRLLCRHPADFLGLTAKGRIAYGYDADLVIWDPESSFVVKQEDIQHRHKLTPYAGRTLFGVVERTILRGANVLEQGPTAESLLCNVNELEYLPAAGFRLAGHTFRWGMTREDVRRQLGTVHTVDDQIIDLRKAAPGQDPIQMRRDIYTNYGGVLNSFFLGYDAEECLMDLEVHEGLSIRIGAVHFAFEDPLEEVLQQLTVAGYTHRLDDEGAVFALEKFNLSDNEMMGGDGHGVAYFYAAEDISHLLEEN